MLLRALSLSLLVCISACQDRDYGFSVSLVSGDATSPTSIPAGGIAIAQVGVYNIQNHDEDQNVCVDLVADRGRLSCPGISCFNAAAVSDGGMSVQSTNHVYLNIPVGLAQRRAFAVYQAPDSAEEDLLTGDAYVTDCSTLVANGGRFSDTEYWSIVVSAPPDLGVAPDAMDMGVSD